MISDKVLIDDPHDDVSIIASLKPSILKAAGKWQCSPRNWKILAWTTGFKFSDEHSMQE